VKGFGESIFRALEALQGLCLFADVRQGGDDEWIVLIHAQLTGYLQTDACTVCVNSLALELVNPPGRDQRVYVGLALFSAGPEKLIGFSQYLRPFVAKGALENGVGVEDEASSGRLREHGAWAVAKDAGKPVQAAVAFALHAAPLLELAGQLLHGPPFA